VTGGSSLVLVVKPSHVPVAAVPSPVNVARSEGATIVAPTDWKTENKPPVAPPYIADCRPAAILPTWWY
jgi:hypothetical protein